MKGIGVPLNYLETDDGIHIARGLEEQTAILDNLVELIIFTPCGSFKADPDFGLDYWNHEYSNINDNQFNNNSTGQNEFSKESTKMRCENSVRHSLMTYAPELKSLAVTMNLDPTDANNQGRRKVLSRHMVTILVEGYLEDGLGTLSPYQKEVSFLVEPTAKKIKI